MKRWIHAADEYPTEKPDLPARPEDITNEYLNTLFKRIDWDDIDYADKLVDRTISKYLGIDKNRIFDQAKYINMLDEDVKDNLLSFLEDPEAVHNRRMKGRKKKTVKPSSKQDKNTVDLYVKYEDYPDGNVKEDLFSGSDRLEALKAMVKDLLLYLDVNEIEDNDMSSEDVINAIAERNGDGCDYIIQLKDKSTNETLMEYDYEDSGDI